ncbi:hypothetical protein TNCV_4018301 [Trichonephila clavipes]|nr:hypothetical protein TNCV_4018301 [Trichonephila clavipes]
MEWNEQQSECCPTQLLLLERIRDIAAKKRRQHFHMYCHLLLFHGPYGLYTGAYGPFVAPNPISGGEFDIEQSFRYHAD